MQAVKDTLIDMDLECSVIVSPHSASSPTGLILVPVCIQEEQPDSSPFSIPLKAFIDSGAMGNFIHPHVVKRFNIPTQPRPMPLQLQTVTGNKFFTVTQQTHVTLVTKKDHKEKITLDVTPIGKHDLILGLLWCRYHDVQFDWINHDITWSPTCQEQCVDKVAPLLVKTLSDNAKPPTRATPGAIRYDLHATNDIIILPHM